MEGCDRHPSLLFLNFFLLTHLIARLGCQILSYAHCHSSLLFRKLSWWGGVSYICTTTVYYSLARLCVCVYVVVHIICMLYVKLFYVCLCVNVHACTLFTLDMRVSMLKSVEGDGWWDDKVNKNKKNNINSSTMSMRRIRENPGRKKKSIEATFKIGIEFVRNNN